VSDSVRVYVNAKPVDVDSTSTALEAVALWDAAQADAVRNGERLITDSRGIVTPSETPVHNGAIFRIVRARQTSSEDPDSNPL
jgi:hypothetical protein